MRLIFSQQYLSIDHFEPIDLPSFSVITGVNGSGKSHLLQAIESGNVLVEGLNSPKVVRFNYETFKLENEGTFNAQQLAQEKEAAWQTWSQQVVNNVKGMRSQLGPEYEDLSTRAIKTKTPLWDQTGSASFSESRQNIDAFFRQPNFVNDSRMHGIHAFVRTQPVLADDFDHDQFFSTYRPYTYKSDFLPSQLGRVFWDYYEKYQTNRFNRFQNEEDGLTLTTISDEDFFAKHGEKPWVIVNEVLRSFSSLDYEVVTPEGKPIFGNYQVRLRSKSNPSLEVDFTNLSSGEQVLLALVATVYKVSSDRHFPGLLLLDEVDASLHPSMMRNLLNVIETVFLKRNVAVVLVTHSPTTVAFAPEESVFLMQRRGTHPRLSKATRGDALSVLTEGFATLEEGIKIFDVVSQNAISIFTEGNNVAYLKLFFELSGVTGVEVISGLESMTGKNQLKTLFDFFSKVPHDKKVLFVWDCDANYSLPEANNTFAFCFPKNPNNDISRTGIENALPPERLREFVKTTRLANGTEITEFDGSCKVALERAIAARRDVSDFVHFESLALKLTSISNS